MHERRVAFDADVLIYSIVPGHHLGLPVARLLDEAPKGSLLGSLLLVPELLIKPTRLGRQEERQALIDCLGRLTLTAVDPRIAELGATLGASYGLKPLDALHLATAVHVDAEIFLTNNRNDFVSDEILELEIVYPDQLGR